MFSAQEINASGRSCVHEANPCATIPVKNGARLSWDLSILFGDNNASIFVGSDKKLMGFKLLLFYPRFPGVRIAMALSNSSLVGRLDGPELTTPLNLTVL